MDERALESGGREQMPIDSNHSLLAGLTDLMLAVPVARFCHSSAKIDEMCMRVAGKGYSEQGYNAAHGKSGGRNISTGESSKKVRLRMKWVTLGLFVLGGFSVMLLLYPSFSIVSRSVRTALFSNPNNEVETTVAFL